MIPAWNLGRSKIRRLLGLSLLLALASVLLLAAWRSALEAPEPTLLITDRHARFLGELGVTTSDDEELGYWPLETLPPRVVAATLAIEDRRFRSHPGVDVLAVGRAFRQLLDSGRRVSGASTLAMQVARMQNPGPRGYLRKGMEAVTALFLTARNGRDALLAHYLRIVPYGNRIHGIGFAARRYLDKPIEDLSWAEVAFLTAIPQAPARMNPFVPAGRLRAIERGKRILAALKLRGEISATEYSVALEQIPNLRVPSRGTRDASMMHALLSLRQQFSKPGSRDAFRFRPIVRTTLDLEIQQEVAWQTFQSVQEWETRGAGNAAVIVLDRATLGVVAWVGSTDYFDARHSGAIDFTGVQRSPGSTLKPFLFGLALEQGVIGPATIVDDLQRARGGITNADETFLGPMLPKVALANSRNVPSANLLARMGIDRGFGFFGALGLHDGLMPARKYGLELAIGGMPTSLAQLVRAYGVLATDGRLRELQWYPNQHPQQGVRLLSEDVARQITLFLADDMARLPSFPRLGATEYPFPVAVKTGTSSGYRDAWTVAYSTRYLTGVWIGHPHARAMNRLSGYRTAARLAQKVLLFLHQDENDGLRKVAFPAPSQSRSLRVCGRTGHLATPACDQVFLEWFKSGQEPTQPCTAHQRLAIDNRDGSLASTTTPAENVELRTFTQLDPQYAAWAAVAGLPRPPTTISSSGPAPTLILAPSSATTTGTDPTQAPTTASAESPEFPPDGSDSDRRSTLRPHGGREQLACWANSWLEAKSCQGNSAGALTGPSNQAPLPSGLAFHPASQPGLSDSSSPPVSTLRITSPEDGERVFPDPEMPPERSTLLLQVVVQPSVQQVVWYVNGEPYQTADYPYTARWQLRRGTYKFQARVPFTDQVSPPVQITVQ